jgi:hypothetical protein
MVVARALKRGNWRNLTKIAMIGSLYFSVIGRMLSVPFGED